MAINNNGRCACGGYIIFEGLLEGGKNQTWRCTDCEQIYYRSIYDLNIYKTLKELEEVHNDNIRAH